MRPQFVTLRADQSLDEALAEVRAEGGLTMAVTEDGRFVGLLTPENVGEFFMIRRALANRPPPRPACRRSSAAAGDCRLASEPGQCNLSSTIERTTVMTEPLTQTEKESILTLCSDGRVRRRRQE